MELYGGPFAEWDCRAELSGRNIGYDGSESSAAESFSWASIAAGLPPASACGTIPAASLVSPALLPFLLHPEKSIVEDAVLPPRVPSVWCSDSEWGLVAKNLVALGICKVIDYQDIAEIGGRKILNGVFGVRKEDACGNIGHRLIFNLTPSNAVQRDLLGDIHKLPSHLQWQTISLGQSEVVLWSSEDLKSCFYVYSLPPAWSKYFTVSKPVDGSFLGLPPGPCYIACRVMPMGWISSCGLIQNIHRNLLLHNPRVSLPASSEIVRGVQLSPLQQDSIRCCWQVYIDNLDVLEIAQELDAPSLKGSMSPLAQIARLIYDQHSVPRSESKAVARQSVVTSLGTQIWGDVGQLALPKLALHKLVRLTLFALQREWLPRKWLQILAGRWVRAALYRRPTMSAFRAIWLACSRKLWCIPMTFAIQRELVLALSLLPLMRADCRLPVSSVLSVSDASQRKGAVCVSSCVTPVGCAEAAMELSYHPVLSDRVLLISIGDPLGIMRVQCRVLSLCLAGAWEISHSFSRVVEYNWPDTNWTNVASFSQAVVQDMKLRACHASHLLVYVSTQDWSPADWDAYLSVLQLLRAEWHSNMACCVRLCQEWSFPAASAFSEFGICSWRYDPWNPLDGAAWFGTSFAVDGWPFDFPQYPVGRASPEQWESLLSLPGRYSLVVERTRYRKSAPHMLAARCLQLLQVSPFLLALLWILGAFLRDSRLWPDLQWPFVADPPPVSEVQAPLVLASALAARADLTGSDVRLTTGDVFKTSAWPRRPLKVHLWEWRTCLSWAWRAQSFITELEARAAVAALKYRIRSWGESNIKFVHGVDNQAALSVLAKGRSSSAVLHRVVQQQSALLLAMNLVVLFTYVDTDSNPADLPSRD
eukprot:1435245-Amphidinium_carterae.2